MSCQCWGQRKGRARARPSPGGDLWRRRNGAGESPPKPKGRAAMGLDDDSDEADLALVPSEPPPKKARKNAAKELRTISCRGMELTVKARDKIRGIAVPLEGPTLMAILKHLRERMTTGEIPEPDAAKSALRKEALENRVHEDKGRLCWKSGESAYQILWQDEDGKTHRRTKRLAGGPERRAG